MSEFWIHPLLRQGILRTVPLATDNPTRRATVLAMLYGPALAGTPYRVWEMLRLTEASGVAPLDAYDLLQRTRADMRANTPTITQAEWVSQPALDILSCQARNPDLPDEILRVRLVVLALWGGDNGQIPDSTVALLSATPLKLAAAERFLILRELEQTPAVMALRCADVIRCMKAAHHDCAQTEQVAIA